MKKNLLVLMVASISMLTFAQEQSGGEQEANQLPVVVLSGTFNSWSVTENPFVAADDKQSASVTLSLPDAGFYEFKVVSDNLWLSKYGEDGNFKVTRAWPRADQVNSVGNVPNMLLIADVAGEYVFTWRYADSTLVVDFPEAGELPVMALAGEFNGWSMDANLFTPAEDKQTGSLTLNLESRDYEFKVIFNNYWLTKLGGEESLYTIHREWPQAPNVDKINVGGNNLLLKADVAGDYIFTWNYSTWSLTVVFPPQEATAVDNINTGAPAQKFFENGQLVIIKNGVRYNALGAQM